jgi:hypothetical protein
MQANRLAILDVPFAADIENPVAAFECVILAVPDMRCAECFVDQHRVAIALTHDFVVGGGIGGCAECEKRCYDKNGTHDVLPFVVSESVFL